MKLLKDKKGSIFQIIGLIILLFVAVTSLVLIFDIGQRLLPAINEKLNDSTENATINYTIQTTLDTTYSYDYAGLAIFAGLVIALVFSAYVTLAHPGFTPVYILILVISTIAAAPISNAYQAIQTQVGHSASFTMTGVIMNNLPLIVAVAGFIFIIVVFIKSRTRSDM